MQLMDHIDTVWGRGTLRSAAEGEAQGMVDEARDVIAELRHPLG